MTVLISISMAWKMLGTSQNSSTLHPFHKSDGLFGYVLLIFSKRTIPNNWIFWIGIDIYHRSTVDMNAQTFGLFPNSSPYFFYSCIVCDRPQGHIPWKGIRGIQPHGQSPFCVHSNH